MRAEVQSILDRSAEANAAVFGGAAATWRRGAKDDAVMAGPFVWTIYAYAAGEDPRRAAIAWLEDFAATMRTTGLDVQVGQLPRLTRHDEAPGGFSAGGFRFPRSRRDCAADGKASASRAGPPPLARGASPQVRGRTCGPHRTTDHPRERGAELAAIQDREPSPPGRGSVERPRR